MKLKTLKDIDKEIEELINSNEKGKLRLDLHHLNNLIREKLKQLAIKWVNNCDNKEDFTTNNMCGFYYDKEKKSKKSRAVFCCCCQRTMKMNNITEEDLK